MKKFQFHLQKVLDMKEKSREQMEWNYVNYMNYVEEQKGQLKKLIDNKETIHQDLIQYQLNGITIHEIHQKQGYLAYLDHQIKEQEESIRISSENLKEKQYELQKSKIDEKIWSNLREKKWQQYLIESNQNEQKETDELVNQRSYK